MREKHEANRLYQSFLLLQFRVAYKFKLFSLKDQNQQNQDASSEQLHARGLKCLGRQRAFRASGVHA